MPGLPRAGHPLVGRALAESRRWCHGHLIDQRPALAHAVTVAVMLGRHVSAPDPALVTAVLLHDAPEFAPPQLDLDRHLAGRYGSEVARIVRALQREHAALDTPAPIIAVDDLPVVLASAADKIVAFGSLLERAVASGEPGRFFATRPGLLTLVPHFARYHQAIKAIVPASMAEEYAHTLRALEQATTAARLPPPSE